MVFAKKPVSGFTEGVTLPVKISRTSIYVAAGRAVGAREPGPSAKNPDYLAEKRLGAQPIAESMARMAVRAREAAPTSPEVQQQMSPERMREQQRLSAYHLAEAVVAS